MGFHVSVQMRMGQMYCVYSKPTSQWATDRIPKSFPIRAFFKNRNADSKRSCSHSDRYSQVASQRYGLAGCQGERFNCSEMKTARNKKGNPIVGVGVSGSSGEEKTRMFLGLAGVREVALHFDQP